MSFITKKISITKFITSKSDDEKREDEDDGQLYGVLLSTGQELFGYLPYPVEDNVLNIHKPLLAIKHFDPSITESAMFLHPWNIISDVEIYPLNAAHIVAVYPVTKDIRLNHLMIWDKAMSMLENEPPQPKLVGHSGKVSDDAVLIIPQQRMPH